MTRATYRFLVIWLTGKLMEIRTRKTKNAVDVKLKKRKKHEKNARGQPATLPQTPPVHLFQFVIHVNKSTQPSLHQIFHRTRTDYLVAKPVTLIHYPIYEPVPAYLFRKSKFISLEPIIASPNLLIYYKNIDHFC